MPGTDDPEGAGDRVDVERILRGIREEIRRRHPEAERPSWEPPGAGLSDTSDPGELGSLPQPAIFSPHLRYLNERWQLDPLFPIHSHRPGVGALIVAWKKLLRKLVMGLFLPVFQAITLFFSNLTNFLNTFAKNVDDATQRLAANDRALADRIRLVAEERRALVVRAERAEKSLVDRMDLLFERLDRERLALERRVEDLETQSGRSGS